MFKKFPGLIRWKPVIIAKVLDFIPFSPRKERERG
jgi:hypothetical protein